LPIAVLISGNGTNLQAIIDNIRSEKLAANIRVVISNNPDAPGIQRAQDHQIQTKIINHKTYSNKEAYETALIETLTTYQPTLIVLAGYMRILSAKFIQHFSQKIINIHPSLLPAYRGLNTHARAINDNAAMHGCSVHVVTEALDSGPVILQAQVAIQPSDSPATLAHRVHAEEYKILPQTIQWIATQRLQLTPKALYFDGKPLNTPLISNHQPALPR